MKVKNRNKLLIIFCFVTLKSLAQIEITPITHDPLRYRNPSAERTAPNARVSNTNFKDTLELPFFEDFTQASAPIDTIVTITDSPLLIKSFGHHGLLRGEKIYFNFFSPNPTNLNGVYYAIPINKREFKISKLPNLEEQVISDGTTLLSDFVLWGKVGAKIGPNPDTLKWEDDGGVYISNRIAINPPSIYVATFDALNADGKPYLNTESRSNTDFLTSQAINLLGMTKDSNIVLSFYVQGGGLGGTPIRSDSIYLLFKDKTNIWKRVWGQKGSVSEFKKFSVPVIDPAYFHNSFQFKFQNFTAINGSVSSTYNIDYIYMDKNWNTNKDFPFDAAVNKSQSSILKQYTSMPVFQFTKNDLVDSVKFSLKNNSDKLTGLGFGQSFVYKDGTSSPINNVNVGFLNSQVSITSGWLVNRDLVRTDGDTCEIKYLIDCRTGDKIDENNRIRWNMNNLDSSKVTLINYYAYDDGSAEANLAIRNTGGRIMTKFTLNNLPDTITHVDIFNPQSRYLATTEPRYRASRIIVADANKNLIETSTTDIALQFPNGRNIFSRYKLKQPFIPTTKDIYIGYEQTHGLEVYYGLDRNAGTSNVIYYGFPQGPWVDQEITGALMIRPVLRIPDQTVGTDGGENTKLSYEIFPNPAKDKVYVKGKLSAIELYNSYGQLLIDQKFAPTNYENIIDIQQLENGIYFLKILAEGKYTTGKLMVER